MTLDKVKEAKLQLEKELKELEVLESKVSEKKSKKQYDNLDIPFQVGKAYFIRTVTYFATGQVKAIVGNFLVLEKAAWIADTGRSRQAIMDGLLNEVEPVEVDMFLNVNSITDAFVWKHELPNKQK